MAKQTGTSNGYKILMQDLRTFITANGWTAVRDTTTASPAPSTFEMIFKGDGDVSPAKEIFFGLQSYEDSGAGYYNWRLRGFTGFIDGSPEGSVLFADQPGASPLSYVPLEETNSISYWFYATGRVVTMIAKTGTSYQFMHCGFPDVFATDDEFPYPMLVMGSTHESTRVFSSNAIEYASSINPGGTSDTTENTDNSAAYMRSVDGSWYPVKNFHVSSGAESVTTNYGFKVDPMRGYSAADWSSDDRMNSASTFKLKFLSVAQGGTPSALLRTADNGASTGASGSRMLVPLLIWMGSPTKMIVGEIHGLFWVSAADGLSAEDTITDTAVSPQDTYTAFQNIHRTDPWCFLAVKDI